MSEGEEQPIPDLGQIHADPPNQETLKEDKTLAKKEAKELFGDDKRNERTKEEFHRCFIWLLRVVAATFGAVFLVRMIHLILPDVASQACIHGWLAEAQIGAIDKIFFSGVTGALLSKYAKEIIPGSTLGKD